MNRMSKLALNSAIAIALAAPMFPSAFADSRNPEVTRVDRDHDRVTTEGRISNIVRERDGYRVQIERNTQWFWIAARDFRGDIRIGTNIRLTGTWRRGQVFVESIEFPVQRVYIRGTVQSVDQRRGLLYVRDEVRRKLITVDATRADRNSRHFDVDEVRRGDYVDVYGDWGAYNVCHAYRIEGRNTPRY